jgi:hypothetical protein
MITPAMAPMMMPIEPLVSAVNAPVGMSDID